MSSLKSTTKEKDNETLIVYLSWEVDESNIDELKNIIEPVLNNSVKNLVLNIRSLYYINSMVIWWFANQITVFSEKWKTFVFSEYNEDIYDILDLVWLTYAIDTYETDEEALLSFEK